MLELFQLDTRAIENLRTIQAGYPRRKIRKSGVKVEDKEEDKEEGEIEGDRFEGVVWSQIIRSPVNGRGQQSRNSH